MSHRKKSQAASADEGTGAPKTGRKRRSTQAPFAWLFGTLVAAGALGAILWTFVGPQRRVTRNPAKAPSTSTASAKVAPGFAEASDVSKETAVADNDWSKHKDDEGPMPDAEKAVTLVQMGNRSLAEGRPAEAIALFRHALLHDPGAEDTHYNLAIALAQAGETEEAIRQYEEALKILPDYAEAHNNLGNLLMKAGKFDQAIEHFNQALQTNPDSASAQNNLGTALARQGKVAQAIVHFAKAVFLMPDYAEAHFNLGNAYSSQGRLDEAIAEFNKTLRLEPGFSPAVSALARARQSKAMRGP